MEGGEDDVVYLLCNDTATTEIYTLSLHDALPISTTVTKDILAAATKLKAIARAGAGVDNIDCARARENGVVVMNTPGGNTNATAEHAFALIMAALRNISFADETTHRGEWQKKAIKGVELSKRSEERRVGKACRSRWSPYQ